MDNRKTILDENHNKAKDKNEIWKTYSSPAYNECMRFARFFNKRGAQSAQAVVTRVRRSGMQVIYCIHDKKQDHILVQNFGQIVGAIFV